VHEVVWDLVNGQYLPTQVVDRPNRRIKFNAAGSPMLVSVGNMLGALIDQPSQFVISRHMPDSDNPYGVALLSSCFWAWTFKTGGWRYFVKYCERHGLPWPIGRYPMGTSEAEQDKLAEALGSMMEAGYVLAPEGTTLELLTPSISSSSNLPQQSLIDLCNREMSKALTGQAMVAELHGTGARAASETANSRQDSINASDREIAAASMNQIFRWITLYNFGPNVAPPSIVFFQDKPAGLERAQTYQTAANLGARPSRSAMLSELGMPVAKDDADALRPARGARPAPAVDDASDGAVQLRGQVGMRFARDARLTDLDAMQLAIGDANQAIADHMIAPVYELLQKFEREGKSLQEFSAALGDIVGVMDDEALRGVIERAITFSILRGAATDAE
jgi:phage gp29-like protein